MWQFWGGMGGCSVGGVEQKVGLTFTPSSLSLSEAVQPYTEALVSVLTK